MLAVESSIVDLVKIIVASMKYLENGYALMCIDNKKVNGNININIAKASTYSSDNRSILSKIKELLRVMNTIIDFEYIKIRGLSDEDIKY